MSGYYTHAMWRVRDGEQAEFIRTWENDLAGAFRTADPSATGTLIQSLDDPSLFFSFGPWPSLDAMAEARQSPAVDRALQALRAMCTEASPGAYRVVLEIPSRESSEP